MYSTLKQTLREDIIRNITISKLQTRLGNNDERKEVFKQIHFLLCESCFWCASYLNPHTISISKCPSCYNNKIKWMPLPSTDIFKLY